jgi:TldD protein
VRLARQAVDVARTARPLNAEPVELADEPVHADRTWVSAYDVDPFEVQPAEKVALLGDWSARLLRSDDVQHVDATLQQALECKSYADTAAHSTLQQRVRVQPKVLATRVDPAGTFETMRSTALPAAGLGVPHRHRLRLGRRARRDADLLAEKAAARSGRAGSGTTW